jgi:CRISPR-associated protein Cas2
MRHLLVVTYDISSPKRWRKVFKCMKGFGQHMQLSVFRCDLTPSEHLEMIDALRRLVHHDEDQLIIVDLGPSQGFQDRVEEIGRPVETEERTARIF